MNEWAGVEKEVRFLIEMSSMRDRFSVEVEVYLIYHCNDRKKNTQMYTGERARDHIHER